MAGRLRARLATGAVLVFGAGVGGYFGSAQLAGSTPNASPRIVTLHYGDVAVFGRLRCGVTSDERSKPRQLRNYYMSCSKRPRSSARYVVDIFPAFISVFDKTSGTQLYHTPVP